MHNQGALKKDQALLHSSASETLCYHLVFYLWKILQENKKCEINIKRSENKQTQPHENKEATSLDLKALDT